MADTDPAVLALLTVAELAAHCTAILAAEAGPYHNMPDRHFWPIYRAAMRAECANLDAVMQLARDDETARQRRRLADLAGKKAWYARGRTAAS